MLLVPTSFGDVNPIFRGVMVRVFLIESPDRISKNPESLHDPQFDPNIVTNPDRTAVIFN